MYECVDVFMLHVCMYVYMDVYMYVCVYVFMLHVCMYVCMYGWMYVCMYICMYVWMYLCMYVCMYVCIYVMSNARAMSAHCRSMTVEPAYGVVGPTYNSRYYRGILIQHMLWFFSGH